MSERLNAATETVERHVLDLDNGHTNHRSNGHDSELLLYESSVVDVISSEELSHGAVRSVPINARSSRLYI